MSLNLPFNLFQAIFTRFPLQLFQYVAAIFHALRNLFHRRRTLRNRIFQLDVHMLGPILLLPVLSQQLQHFRNRRFALPPRHVLVRTSMLRPCLVLHVNREDAIVIFADHITGIIACESKVMASIKVQHRSLAVAQIGIERVVGEILLQAQVAAITFPDVFS